MKILLVVDLQTEFADSDGEYERILKFVQEAIENKAYNKVIATKCLNRENSNFVRYSNWGKMIDGAAKLEFTPDTVIEKISYGLTDYSMLPTDAHIDVVGYNTGACVLKVALDLFDRDYNFTVLSHYCYSSSGLEHHRRGLWTLKNLLENAVR
ncbi:MAG: isochorismatase family protein [Hominilimicola sp.]